MISEAVILVPENAAAGKINGKQLAGRAPLHGAPGPASAAGVVVRIEAGHNDPRGLRKAADEFRQVRGALHLCVGARVMLTLNRIWDVPTVPLGLMNGARGVVVAIVYAPAGGGERMAVASQAPGAPVPRWVLFPGAPQPAQCLILWSCTSPSTKAPLASTTCRRPGCRFPARRCDTRPCNRRLAQLCHCAWRGCLPSISRKASQPTRGASSPLTAAVAQRQRGSSGSLLWRGRGLRAGTAWPSTNFLPWRISFPCA